jgi:hypothetical protein
MTRFRETRREWMERMLSLGALAPIFPTAAAFASSTQSATPRTKWSIPGLYRGKVVEVEHPASIQAGVVNREVVRTMLRRGMQELTGAPDWIAAWKMFFQPGEVVGLKLNPVSRPYVISSPETVQEIIVCLEACGIKRKDIVAYDRYKQEFYEAGFDKWLPEGVRVAWAADYYDNTQQKIEGYDLEHYMDMQLTLPGFEFSNDTARRSYAATFITKQVDKLVNLCLLKHHQSAGLTVALKNLSHGLVNNVNRSHSSPELNSCGQFIPTSVSIPVIRNKTVLNICDATKALYHGGPGLNPKKVKYVWEHKRMYFSTDPVAMDRIAWDHLDEKRVAMGMEPLAIARRDADSNFVRMQPEHVDISGALGLGEGDRKKIDHRKVKLG